MTNTQNLTDEELKQAFEDNGYRVIKIQHWRKTEETYVVITPGSLKRLENATNFGMTLGVKVSQPC